MAESERSCQSIALTFPDVTLLNFDFHANSFLLMLVTWSEPVKGHAAHNLWPISVESSILHNVLEYYLCTGIFHEVCWAIVSKFCWMAVHKIYLSGYASVVNGAHFHSIECPWHVICFCHVQLFLQRYMHKLMMAISKTTPIGLYVPFLQYVPSLPYAPSPMYSCDG